MPRRPPSAASSYNPPMSALASTAQIQTQAQSVHDPFTDLNPPTTAPTSIPSFSLHRNTRTSSHPATAPEPAPRVRRNLFSRRGVSVEPTAAPVSISSSSLTAGKQPSTAPSSFLFAAGPSTAGTRDSGRIADSTGVAFKMGGDGTSASSHTEEPPELRRTRNAVEGVYDGDGDRDGVWGQTSAEDLAWPAARGKSKLANVREGDDDDILIRDANGNYMSDPFVIAGIDRNDKTWSLQAQRTGTGADDEGQPSDETEEELDTSMIDLYRAQWYDDRNDAQVDMRELKSQLQACLRRKVSEAEEEDWMREAQGISEEESPK